MSGARARTVRLMLAGLALGCLNAWRWVTQQDSAMHAAARAAQPVADPADPIAGRVTVHETEH